MYDEENMSEHTNPEEESEKRPSTSQLDECPNEIEYEE